MRKIDINCYDDYRTVIALEIGKDSDITSISEANAKEIVNKYKDHKWIHATIRHEKSSFREYDVLEVGVKHPNCTIISDSNTNKELNYKSSYRLEHG